MLELKGEIKRENEKHVGFTQWVKLTVGNAGFKLGEVMISPHFPGLHDYETTIKREITKQLDHLKTKELAPRMRKMYDLHKNEGADKSEMKRLEVEIEHIKRKISSLEHSYHAHHEIEGKKFRLIIYDG